MRCSLVSRLLLIALTRLNPPAGRAGAGEGSTRHGRQAGRHLRGPHRAGAAGLLSGRSATSYPGFGDQLTGATLCEARVVVDELITTSRGPGTALEFSLELVRQLAGDDAATSLSEAVLVG